MVNDDDYQVGDAILTTATFQIPNNGGQIMYEWVDVAIYDDAYAVQWVSVVLVWF